MKMLYELHKTSHEFILISVKLTKIVVYFREDTLIFHEIHEILIKFS